MAAVTVPISEPSIFLAGTSSEPDILSYPLTAAQTPARGAFVVLVSGAVSLVTSPVPAANGTVGMLAHDYNAVYSGSGDTLTVSAANTTLFGQETTAGITLPKEIGNMHVVAAHNGAIFAMNLSTAYGAYVVATGGAGNTTGVILDPGTSGFYVADAGNATASAKIVGEVNGPQANYGTVGDTNKRVLVSFLAAAVQV